MDTVTELAETTTTPGQPPTELPGPADQARSDTAAVAGSRRMMAVVDLAAHPGNVRADLNLTDEFTASIAAEGVRIPLLITPAEDGRWRVIEGHRRLAAAIAAGLPEVPCDIDPDRVGDEAGQYLDMLLANSDSYRANYTPAEEAAALFAAHEAGATRTRLRKATGRTPAQVKTALTAGGLSPDTKAAATALDRPPSLDDLALLAEFDSDPDATARLLRALDQRYPVEHVAERIRQERAEAAEHARVRAEVEQAGVPVTDSLPDGAMWLHSLSHDSAALTSETHAACPGHAAIFQSWNLAHPAYYCASPAEHGHVSQYDLIRAGTGTGTISGSASGHGDPNPAGTAPLPEPAPDPSRRIVIEGNRAWQAAAEVRHRWLASTLFPRRTLPRDAAAFVAGQLLAMPDPLHSGLPAARNQPLFTTLTGRSADEWKAECDTATTGRLTVALLAPLVTAYEHAMTSGEGRNTWRTDRYSPCPRSRAGQYLAFLASLGYQLSDIEQAVADSIPWTGDTPGTTLTITDPAPGDTSADGDTGQQADPAPTDGHHATDSGESAMDDAA
jgi:ParB family chromosome partitioning protein